MQTLLSMNPADSVTPATPVFSRGGFPVGSVLYRAYWAAKLKDGSWWCEEDEVSDMLIGRRRLDWTLDIVSTGDNEKIVELWLFCPNGSRARLPIERPGTAFQFKVALMDTVCVDSVRKGEAQLIGRVTDSETGDCECFIYDYRLQAMSEPWKSNVYSFGSWKPGIAPLGALAHGVLGLRLESEATPKLAAENDDCGCENSE